MLLNIPYRPGDTVTVKLSTGEEVLGKYVGDEKDSISISKPVVLTPTPQGQIALTPYIFSGDSDNVLFKNHHVICITSAKKQFSDNYIQATTGIQTVSTLG